MLVVLVFFAIIPSAVAQPSGWPTTWTGLTADPNEGGCSEHRNVFDTNGDTYALYYATDSQYLYLRMETVDPPGWPSTGVSGKARYKWFFDTAGTAATLQGGSVGGAEFLLILEDLTDNSNDPDETRDQLGELTLMDDLNNDGFSARWDSANPPNYTINNAQTAPTGASSWWRRELGSGTAGTGGPQGLMGADVGYRIANNTTGGNFVDMYISWAALGNPSSLYLLWATDNHNPNLDQSPNCDCPESSSSIPVCVPPVAAFNATPTSGCAPLTVQFTDTSTGSPTGWSWSFPGGSPASANTQGPHTVTYSSSGTYDVTLNVTNACGSDDEAKTSYITVSPKPVATASSNSPVCEGDTIELYGGPGGMTTYSWTGPNSFTSSLQNPTIPGATTAMSGTYTLTVTDGGCTSDPVNTSVTVNTKPTTTASSNSPVCEGETIELYGGPGGMTTYSWTGPNSFTSSLQNPTIPGATTAMDGTYTLTVTDGGCTSDPVTTAVTVNTAPVANFDADITSGCAPLTVQFTDTSAGSPTSWSWSFPGGSPLSANTQGPHTVTYSSPGTYTISLTVSNDCGSDDETKTSYITVSEAPTASASSNSPVSEGADIQLYGGPDSMITYSWTGPGGWTSNAQNDTRTGATLAMAGTYTLTVTKSDGCSASDTTDVIVSIVTYNISGAIWVDGTPLAGVLVTASSGSWTGTAITDANGEYVLTGVPHGETEIHIIPTVAGYTFDPPIIIVTEPMTTSLEHQDFAAALAQCGYDGVLPATYAKIPFAIIETGLMLVGDIIALLPEDWGIPAWLSTVTDTIATWSGGPLSWTVDMLGWGLSLVGGILDTLAPTLGLPDWLGDVLNEVACELFTPFDCVVGDAWDPCG